MEPSYNFPPDDYALAILTHAAMQTHSSETTSNSSYERPAARDGIRSPTGLIIKQRDDTSQHPPQRANVISSRAPDILSSYNSLPPSRSMETLTVNQNQGRQYPYMNQSYTVGTQISENYGNNLGILNAESYDDGRLLMSTQEARAIGKNSSDVILPFGIADRSDMGARTESDELEKGGRTKRSKKHKIDLPVADDDEEARKKARGRPRVDTKDETAADRRRTQIRMAQRAYRHRKETTITSLEKQVQELRGTNEEMSNIFISLYDFAVGKGLLQREPEFGHQLQSTTERFLALAKASATDDETHEENLPEEKGKQTDPENARRTKGSRSATKRGQKEPPQVDEPVNPWGGYSISKEDSPNEEIPLDLSHDGYEHRTRQGDLQVITRPTPDNASFPFDFMDLQQFQVQVPPAEDFTQHFFPQYQPPLPQSHAHTEFSFARRLHRAAVERAFMLITAGSPPPKRFKQVFGFSLLYETKESIKNRLKACLEKTSKDSLQNWRVPILHLGGSGTFYPMHGSDFSGNLMPKLQTGYSMGPFSPSISKAQEFLQDDLRSTFPGFEGEWFDPNDVESYLRGHGLDIPASADFITAEIDVSILTEVGSPGNSESVSTISPRTPPSPQPISAKHSYSCNYDFNKPEAKAFPFPLGFANWDSNVNVKEGTNMDPIFTTMISQTTESQSAPMNDVPYPERRLVTINVNFLVDEILDHGVCLGRAPGFRPTDVNAAIIAAVKAGS